MRVANDTPAFIATGGNHTAPQVYVVIEIPRGSFLKHGTSGELDFVSPFPCPFNYGSIHGYVGGDNDLLDALVLGPRLARGTRVAVPARGAVGLTDRDVYDDKLVCSRQPLDPWQRRAVLLFFHFYAFSKRFLNRYRGRRGRTVCEGWGDAAAAISRARPSAGWQGPAVPF